MNTESIIETSWGCNKCGSDNLMKDSNCFHCGMHKGFKAEKFKNIETLKMDKNERMKAEIFNRMEKQDKSFWLVRGLGRIIMLLGIVGGTIALISGNGKAIVANAFILIIGFLIWIPFAIMRSSIVRSRADKEIKRILSRERKS